MKKKMKKQQRAALICAALILLAGVAGIFGLYYSNEVKAQEARREQDRVMVESYKETAVACETAIKEFLGAESSDAQVFDATGAYLFTTTTAYSAVDYAAVEPARWQLLQDTLLSGATLSTINLDSWSASRDEGAPVVDAKTVQGSLGWVVVNKYCAHEGVILTDVAKMVIAASLDANLSREEMLTYCASVAQFAGITGMENASDTLFSKPLYELNTWQWQYLVHACDKTLVVWEDYATQYPEQTGGATTAETFGLVGDAPAATTFLREKTAAELNSILTEEERAKVAKIYLGINDTLQTQLQLAIDAAMQDSIAVGSAGQTVLDCNVLLVESKTGRIVSSIGGRGVNTIASNLSFVADSNIGIFEAARTAFQEDSTLTAYSIVDTIEHETTSAAAIFMEVVQSNAFSLMGINCTQRATITPAETAEFFNSLYNDGKPVYIMQVQDDEGNVLFEREAPADVSTINGNADTRVLIAGTPNVTQVPYMQAAAAGYVQAVANDQYILVVAFGSSGQGYAMTEEDYAITVKAYEAVVAEVERYFTTAPGSIDPGGVVAQKLEQAQIRNAEVISTQANEWIEELRTMPINSVEARNTFESNYKAYSQNISGYLGILSNESVANLLSALDAVRTERTPELLKYVA